MNSTAAGPGLSPSDRRALFWACFIAIAATTAVFPALMLVGYVGLWAVLGSRGGYQPLARVQAAPAKGHANDTL